MKVLTRKSRTAILIFLSVITLTLVAHITIAPTPNFKDLNYKQFTVVTTTYQQLRHTTTENQLVRGSQLATNPKQFKNDQTVTAFRPWTVLASPRAPPA